MTHSHTQTHKHTDTLAHTTRESERRRDRERHTHTHTYILTYKTRYLSDFIFFLFQASMFVHNTHMSL